jgi:hypothetical protein
MAATSSKVILAGFSAKALSRAQGGGLRRSEVVALLLADYDPTHQALTVRHGKGNKARIGTVAEATPAAGSACPGGVRAPGSGEVSALLAQRGDQTPCLLPLSASESAG